jgi:site-specific recombinase XerD
MYAQLLLFIHFLFGISREHVWLAVKNCASRAGLDQLVNRETGEVRGISPHRLRDAFGTQKGYREIRRILQ